MSTALFFAVQSLSVVAAIAIILEHRRVSRKRAEIFQHLGCCVTGKKVKLFLLTLYLCSTALIITMSFFIFFQQFHTS